MHKARARLKRFGIEDNDMRVVSPLMSRKMYFPSLLVSIQLHSFGYIRLNRGLKLATSEV